MRTNITKKSENPGPGTYSANHIAETSKSIKFGTSVRPGLIKNTNTPAPDKYNITGDFDFRDPSKNDGKEGGKVAKFCFGMKPNLRAKNLDQPGPGEYEVDYVPMNQTDIAHLIGTSVRRDPGVPKAHLYPGPGHYEKDDRNQGAHISFTKDKKITTIEKNYQPAPDRKSVV